MIQAMFNGVSGLKAHKTELDVIGNNIANVNTVGFKASTVTFREMLSQTLKGASAPSGGIGGTNPMQIGMGTGIGSIDVNMKQGPLLPTGKKSDVAIEGNGYLILSDGQGQYYTRDGSFKLDGENNLVSAATGLKVLGWSANLTTGELMDNLPLTMSSSLKIPLNQLSISRQTSDISFGGNLDARTAVGGNFSPSAKVYDSLGIAHTITVNYTRLDTKVSQSYADTDTTTLGTGDISMKVGDNNPVNITLDGTNNTLQGLCDTINASATGVTASIEKSANGFKLSLTEKTGKTVTLDTTNLVAGGGTVPAFTISPENQWSWSATSDDADPTIPLGSGFVAFNKDGQQKAGETPNITLKLAHPNGSADPIETTLSFLPITQQAGEATVRELSQNGLPMGVLKDFNISEDGIISGEFTNGTTQTLGRIALAQFSNPDGLSKAGSNMMVESSNSGVPQIGHPNVGSMGKLTATFLESSNVDLPTEFANMIVAQRGFQANSRIITTSDEILQELVQLKR